MIEIVRDWSKDDNVIGVGASLRIMKKNIVKRSDQRGLDDKARQKD